MHMPKYSELREIKGTTILRWILFFCALIIFSKKFPMLEVFGCLGIVDIGLFWFLYHYFGERRCCSADGIQHYVGKSLREQINYQQIELMVISNSMYSARYQVRSGQYIKINGKKKFVQSAHLTLFSKLEKIMDLDLAPGKQSSDLYIHNNQRCFPFLGSLSDNICWPDYLEELLTHVQTAPIYILEDVYVRFQPDYDRIFSKAKNPIYIITAPQTCRQYLRKNVI